MKVKILVNGGYIGIEDLISKVFDAEEEKKGLFLVEVGTDYSISGKLYFYESEVEVVER